MTETPPYLPEPFRRRQLPYLLMGLFAALVYVNAQRGPFLLDDNYSIAANPSIRRLWPISAALNPPPGKLSFCTRPIVNLTMCVDYVLGGLEPRVYRRTNLAFHVAAALALYGLARRTLISAGFNALTAIQLGSAATLLWAVHPLNTAAVNYLSQRGELGVALFFFLMLYCINRSAGRSRPWMAAAVCSCLLGMGSKESMAAAPVLALFYDRAFLSDSWRAVFRSRWGFYLLLAATWLWPLYRHLAFSPHLPDGGFDADIFWRYPLTQAWGLTRMVRLAFWPSPLIFDYGSQLVDRAGQVIPHLVFIGALVILTGWAAFRHPRAGFLPLCFLALLAPSSSFFPVTGQPIAEHRMYAPLAAWAVLVALVLWPFFRNKKAFLGLAALWALALGAASLTRNTVYADRVALWQDTAAKRPASERAWNSLGQALNDEGRFEEALEAYQQALRLDPTALGHVNAGIALNALGRSDEAVTHYQEALRLDPAMAAAENRLGVALANLGRHEESLAAQERAMRIQPDYAPAHAHLADQLVALRREAEALAHYRRAVRLQPDLTEAHAGLAVALLNRGRTDDAQTALLNAVQSSPEPARACFALATRLLLAGHQTAALDMLRRHLELESWHPVSLNNAAWIMATSTNAALRDGEEALRLARRALDQTKVRDPALWSTLAAAQAEAGQFKPALANAQKALEMAQEQDRTNLFEKYQQRMERYKLHLPWRE